VQGQTSGFHGVPLLYPSPHPALARSFLYLILWCWGLNPAHGRPGLYHLSHTPSPFVCLFVIFIYLFIVVLGLNSGPTP
jgi:hypothetical protein